MNKFTFGIVIILDGIERANRLRPSRKIPAVVLIILDGIESVSNLVDLIDQDPEIILDGIESFIITLTYPSPLPTSIILDGIERLFSLKAGFWL